MGVLVNVVLPLSLAIIMLSLGIGLQLSDFQRVANRKMVFLVGALCQIIFISFGCRLLRLQFGTRS